MHDQSLSPVIPLLFLSFLIRSGTQHSASQHSCFASSLYQGASYLVVAPIGSDTAAEPSAIRTRNHVYVKQFSHNACAYYTIAKNWNNNMIVLIMCLLKGCAH